MIIDQGLRVNIWFSNCSSTGLVSNIQAGRSSRLVQSYTKFWGTEMAIGPGLKQVQNRMHAVRSIALMRDVYGEEAETDFRFGIVKARWLLY